MRKIPKGRVANKSNLLKVRISYQSVGGWRSRHSEDQTAMYVCLCNALTDRQVMQAAVTAGTTKPSSVYAACGCRAQCGQCVKALVTLLRGGDCAMAGTAGHQLITRREEKTGCHGNFENIDLSVVDHAGT